MSSLQALPQLKPCRVFHQYFLKHLRKQQLSTTICWDQARVLSSTSERPCIMSICGYIGRVASCKTSCPVWDSDEGTVIYSIFFRKLHTGKLHLRMKSWLCLSSGMSSCTCNIFAKYFFSSQQSRSHIITSSLQRGDPFNSNKLVLMPLHKKASAERSL